MMFGRYYICTVLNCCATTERNIEIRVKTGAEYSPNDRNLTLLQCADALAISIEWMSQLGALILWLSTLDSCEPIMVTYGTNRGPILPRERIPDSIQPKTIFPRSPAPVKEDREDLPNPYHYQPLFPHQYRTKLYSFKPQQNLILGTPLDQRYTPSLAKYDLNRKQYSRNLGPEYTGPHTFDKQDYELYEIRKTTLQPSVRYSNEELQHRLKADQQAKYVPQIGIVYSSGVRYYVPQISYYSQDSGNGEDENSVYDKNDEKYYVYQQ